MLTPVLKPSWIIWSLSTKLIGYTDIAIPLNKKPALPLEVRGQTLQYNMYIWFIQTSDFYSRLFIDNSAIVTEWILVQCNFNPTRMLNETDGNILDLILTKIPDLVQVMLKYWLIILTLIIFLSALVLKFCLVDLVRLSQGRSIILRRQA